MLVFKENLYGSCGGDNIILLVVDLEVKWLNGSKFVISGLKNEIDIRIYYNKCLFDVD